MQVEQTLFKVGHRGEDGLLFTRASLETLVDEFRVNLPVRYGDAEQGKITAMRIAGDELIVTIELNEDGESLLGGSPASWTFQPAGLYKFNHVYGKSRNVYPGEITLQGAIIFLGRAVVPTDLLPSTTTPLPTDEMVERDMTISVAAVPQLSQVVVNFGTIGVTTIGIPKDKAVDLGNAIIMAANELIDA